MLMQCPVCANKLTEREANGFHIDVCESGCAGIWFDSTELDRCDSHRDKFPNELLRVKSNSDVAIDRSKRRNCPKCTGTVMERLFFKADDNFEIDRCTNCQGHWLDIGELEYLRNHSKSRDIVKIELAEFQEKFREQLGPDGSARLNAIYHLIFS